MALEYIFFHNDDDTKDSSGNVPEPKYIGLNKKVAHATVEDADEEVKADDGQPR